MDIAKIRNVAFVGHGGVGKTSLVEAILFACGASTRLGKRGRRDHHHRLRPRRDQAQDLAEHRGRPSAIQGSPAQPDRHPRVRRLRRRRARRPAGGRGGGGGGGRGGRRAGADREGLEVRQRVRSAARDRHQPARPRAGRLLPHARVPAEAAEGPARADACPDRRARRLHGRGGPDRDEGPRAAPTARSRRPRSRPSSTDARQDLSREAGGGRRRDRRRSPREVSRGGLDRRGRDARRAAHGRSRRARSCPCCAAAATARHRRARRCST